MNENSSFKKYSLLVIFIILVMTACAQLSPERPDTQFMNPTITVEPIPEKAQPNTEREETALLPPAGWAVEMVAEGLDIPWSVVFPSENRILISERSGSIREIVAGRLNPEPIFQFDEVDLQGEAGLMGLALDPEFENNRYLYACYATDAGSGLVDRIARLIDTETSISLDAVLLDNIPAAKYHSGCRLEFSPDGKLYITTGDATQPELAQDIESLAGKILRINPDGTIPDDNPIGGSPVFSYGHRNPQGIDWDPQTSRLYSSEHGPSGFDGPQGGDEINIIEAGGNYGWPLISHDETLEGTFHPIIQFTPAEAPASLLFYDSKTLPFFTGSLFFGALRGEGLVRIILSQDGKEVKEVEKIVDDVGRVRDVVSGPDGLIYFTTSNRDGRGNLRDGDDKLFRIIPVFEE